VAVSDAGFGTDMIRLPEGGTAHWTFDTSNRQYHKVSAFFFTSPAEPPGAAFSQQFGNAGTYAIDDSPSGDTMRVDVPVGVSPASGTCSTSLVVVGARGAPGPLFVHTYQVLIPGGSWRTVLTDTLGMYFRYTPGGHCESGTYAFRAQTVLYDNHGMHSGWSAPVAVSVTA